MFLELKVKYLQSCMESFSSYADEIQQKQQQKYPTDFKQNSYDVLAQISPCVRVTSRAKLNDIKEVCRHCIPTFPISHLKSS